MSRRFVSSNETENQPLPGQVNHWYFKDGLSEVDSLVFVRAHIQYGAGHPFHTHPEMDEIIYILEGEMERGHRGELLGNECNGGRCRGPASELTQPLVVQVVARLAARRGGYSSDEGGNGVLGADRATGGRGS